MFVSSGLLVRSYHSFRFIFFTYLWCFVTAFLFIIPQAAAGFAQHDDVGGVIKNKDSITMKKCSVFDQFRSPHQSSTTTSSSDYDQDQAPASIPSPVAHTKCLPHILCNDRSSSGAEGETQQSITGLTENDDAMYFKEILHYSKHDDNTTGKTAWYGVKLYYDSLKMRSN